MSMLRATGTGRFAVEPVVIDGPNLEVHGRIAFGTSKKTDAGEWIDYGTIFVSFKTGTKSAAYRLRDGKKGDTVHVTDASIYEVEHEQGGKRATLVINHCGLERKGEYSLKARIDRNTANMPPLPPELGGDGKSPAAVNTEAPAPAPAPVPQASDKDEIPF